MNSSVNRTLVQRAYNICDKDSLPKELQHIRTTLKRNGYNPNKISTAKPVPNPESKVSDLTLSACLPYLGSTSHKLQRIRTSAFSSATFGDQYYRLKDLLYPKSITHTRLRDHLYPKSTTLLPLCLLTTDSVQ